MRGISDSGGNGDSGPSAYNGNSGSTPNWQRLLYGWVRDASCWDFMEPDGCS